MNKSILGFVLFAILLFTSFFPILSSVQNAQGFKTSIETTETTDFLIDSNWTSPTEGTVLRNSCDSNGNISTSSSCSYLIEYNVSNADSGTPESLKYSFTKPQESDEGTVKVSTFNETDSTISQVAVLEENLTGGTITKGLDFDSRQIDLIELEYNLTDGGTANRNPALDSSKLTITQKFNSEDIGLGDDAVLIFVLISFLAVVMMALLNA